MFIITVKLPKNKEHLAALKCDKTNDHPKTNLRGHCSEMSCPNYINKCPKHSIPAIAPDTSSCSRDKVTGYCPVGNGICTDVTGEHHSYIDSEAKTIEEARSNAEDLGIKHITRIEEFTLSLPLAR